MHKKNLPFQPSLSQASSIQTEEAVLTLNWHQCLLLYINIYLQDEDVFGNDS